MVSLATVISFFLPNIKKTVYFHTGKDHPSNRENGKNSLATMMLTLICHLNLFMRFLHCILTLVYADEVIQPTQNQRSETEE